MNVTHNCSSAVCRNWKLLHWVELILGVSGLIWNSCCLIRIIHKFRKKFDYSVTFLLLNAVFLLLVASLYCTIKPIVILFYPFTTSLLISFIIGIFAALPFQLSPLMTMILLLERNYTIKCSRTVRTAWLNFIVSFIYSIGIAVHFVYYRIVLRFPPL